MKLLQEVRGLAQLTDRRPQTRPAALLLQAHWLSRRGPAAKNKRVLRIQVQNLPDIPHPVRINHVTRAADASGARGD